MLTAGASLILFCYCSVLVTLLPWGEFKLYNAFGGEGYLKLNIG